MTQLHPPPGSCALCGRTDQPLALEHIAGQVLPRVVCADEASCVRTRIARDAANVSSTWRDQAERHIDLADRSLGGASAAAQVRATQAVAYALLAVAEAITAAPASDLVGVLDAGLSNLVPDFTPEMREERA